MEQQKGAILYKLYFLLLIYVSGSIFCTAYLYKQSVIAFFAITFVTYLVVENKRRKALSIEKNKISILFVLLFFVFIVIVLQRPASISSYIAITLQLITSMLVTRIVDYNEFKRIYCDVMFFLSAISIVCYLIYICIPTIALLFPKIEGISSLDYYYAGLYVFPSARGYGSFVPFYRNCSIFWEPGCFQAFVNIALLFQLQDTSGELKKRDVLRLFVFILAIITTFSTTGYVIMILMLVKYSGVFLNNKNIFGTVFAIIVLGISVFFMLSKTSIGSFFTQKISREFGHIDNILGRLRLNEAVLFIQYPSSFLGMSFEKYQQIGTGTGNSLLQTMLVLGIPFTSVLMSMYVSIAKKSKSTLFMLLILIFIFSTESLIWRPFFLCLAWYGISKEC